MQDLSRPAAQARPVRPASLTGQTGRPQGRPKTFEPKRTEVGTWKANESKVQGGVAKHKPSFDQLLNKYTKAVAKDRPLKKISKSPPRQGKPSSPRGGSRKHRGDVTTKFPPQRVYINMPWTSSASDSSCPTWEHEEVWMQCYPMPHLPSHQRGGYFRRPVFHRFSRPVHDRLGSYQTGQRQ